MNERANRPYTQAQGVDLKDYVDNEFRLCREVRRTKFEAMEASAKEAIRLMELRLGEMNEIRKQLKVQADTFLLKGEYLVQHKGLSDRVDDLVQVTATHVSRSELLAVAGLVSAAVSAIVMIVLHILGLK